MIKWMTWIARRSALVNWGFGWIDIGGPLGFCWIVILAGRSALNIRINELFLEE